MADNVDFTAEALPAVPAGPVVVEAPAAHAVAAEPVAPAPAPAIAAKPGRKPRMAKAPRAATPAKAPARRAPRKAAVIQNPATVPAQQAAAKPARRVNAKRAASQGQAKPTRQTSKLGTGMPIPPQFKEMLMATPFDFSTVQTSFTELQGKAKAALEKSTAALGDANEFAKGNVEAVVESGKILSAGLQDLGATLVAETRDAFDAIAADAKELAAAKSPTEFFQLQSELLSSNFDAFAKESAKASEAWLKLAGDVVQPISTRVSVVTEKVRSLSA
jgi:phasin family protein